MGLFTPKPNSTKQNWIGANDRAKQAIEHIAEMNKKYSEEIKESVVNTKRYDARQDEELLATVKPKDNPFNQRIIQNTTDGALYEYADSKKTALLNFASYKVPGGGFTKGAKAQEECLCMVSTLYNIISDDNFKYYYEFNNGSLNRGLYRDRALYSPDVIFEDKDGKTYKADVITCAAPNRSVRLSEKILNAEKLFTDEENYEVLGKRIEFIRDICLHNNVDRVILGAWGCGVFSQETDKVAELFYEGFKNSGIECIYAIPDEKNYTLFKDAFQNRLNEEHLKDVKESLDALSDR